MKIFCRKGVCHTLPLSALSDSLDNSDTLAMMVDFMPNCVSYKALSFTFLDSMYHARVDADNRGARIVLRTQFTFSPLAEISYRNLNAACAYRCTHVHLRKSTPSAMSISRSTRASTSPTLQPSRTASAAAVPAA